MDLWKGLGISEPSTHKIFETKSSSPGLDSDKPHLYNVNWSYNKPHFELIVLFSLFPVKSLELNPQVLHYFWIPKLLEFSRTPFILWGTGGE